MSENVTISTFLELKDNMSGGLNKAIHELEQLNATSRQAASAAQSMQAAHDSASARIVAAIDRQTEHLKQFTSKAEEAKRAMGAGGMASGVDQANESMTSSIMKGNLLSDVLMKVATAAFDMGKNFLQSSVQLHSTIETTSIQIASSLKAFDLAPSMQSAQNMAIGTMKRIRDMAAVLPGEANEYVKVFSLALPKAIESGMRDLDQIATLTSKYAAVAKMNVVDAQQAGMDMFRILAGQAGGDVAMWTRLSAHIRMTAEAFNKLPAPERLALFAGAVDQAGQGIALYEETYESLSGTLMSLWAEIQEAGTANMFSEVNQILKDMIAYLTQNKQEIIGIAHMIGTGIVGALKLMIGFAVMFEKSLAVIAGLFDAIQSSVETIRDTFGMLRASASAFLADADGLTERMDNATAAARRYNEEREKDRAAEAQHHRNMVSLQKQAQQEEAGIAERERVEANRLHVKAQDWYEALNKRIGGPEVGARASDVMKKLKAEVVSGKIAREQAVQYLASKGMENMQSLFESKLKGIPTEKDKKGRKGAREPKAHKATHKKDVYDFRYSKFDIRQEFAEGFDPDRIATAFASDLGRLGEMKAAAVYAPLFSGG